MFLRRPRNRLPEIETARLLLRAPQMVDYPEWAQLRRQSRGFLQPWEPAWARDHLSSRSFRNRVIWAERAIKQGDALPLFLIRTEDGAVLGGLTLSNIRREPAQAGTLGYWIGEQFARAGYMTEALGALREHAFAEMDLSRLEAACLPDNAASRRLLERCQFKYEGVAQAYLQIDGRWRNHVLYASLRSDRRGRVDDMAR
ncbi:GNAT family N-acetyltransferase [Limibaculum sp. M0105]|uniref:GNAT family N-acetyltransferase n=1 Tax=Thermohalobaculum xanthum TaxID=2753746 RepID=A0A8J7M490_9RHOB|nr:GNAT family protein [Thermohalobaculum xanthum]MBK0397923.1 GNAT family N-acetyltransferase [Thermohalobaculum xanthum]